MINSNSTIVVTAMENSIDFFFTKPNLLPFHNDNGSTAWMYKMPPHTTSATCPPLVGLVLFDVLVK